MARRYHLKSHRHAGLFALASSEVGREGLVGIRVVGLVACLTLLGCLDLLGSGVGSATLALATLAGE